MIPWYELLIYALYGLPFFVINAKITYVLWAKKKHFTSSYYRIYFFCSLNDCFLYLTSNFLVRLPSVQILYDVYFSEFTELSFYNTPIHFLSFFCSYFTTLGAFLLSFNRLTAVWVYQSYEQIWKRFVLSALLLSFLATLTFTFSGMFTLIAFKYTVLGNSSLVMLSKKPLVNPWDVNTVNAWTVGIFTFSGLFVNITTLVLWAKQKSLIPGAHQLHQRRLLFLTVVVYSLHFISFCYNSLKTYFLTDPIVLYRVYSLVTDMISLIPNVAFVIASPTMRGFVIPRWLREKWNRKVTTTSVVPKTTSFAYSHE